MIVIIGHILNMWFQPLAERISAMDIDKQGESSWKRTFVDWMFSLLVIIIFIVTSMLVIGFGVVGVAIMLQGFNLVMASIGVPTSVALSFCFLLIVGIFLHALYITYVQPLVRVHEWIIKHNNFEPNDQPVPAGLNEYLAKHPDALIHPRSPYPVVTPSQLDHWGSGDTPTPVDPMNPVDWQ